MSNIESWAGLGAFGLSILLSQVAFHYEAFQRKPIVKGLYVYPIKSCKGMRVSSSLITRRGLQYDRIFMLVASDGNFITQRKYPKMALIQPVILYEEETMVITAPGMRELRVSLQAPPTPVEGQATVAKVWGDSCNAIEITDNDCQQWFASYLSVPDVKLVRMQEEFVRKTDPKYAPNGQTSFSDGYPFLLISEESLSSLNKTLTVPITMERFRPNIVVSNVSAFAEDIWKKISLNCKEDRDIVMNVVKPCSRCTIPNIDPMTAESDPAPTVAMKTFRTGEHLQLSNPKWKREVFFGQNLDHEGKEGLTLHVGADLQVLA